MEVLIPMRKLNMNKSRPLFLCFIISCCLVILASSHFLFPPFSNSDDLDVLILNKEASPIFRLDAQLSYTPELVDTWSHTFANQTTPTLDSSNRSPLEQKTEQQLEKPQKPVEQPEPSPYKDASTTVKGLSDSTHSNINLLIDLTYETLEIDTLLKDLTILSQTSKEVTLSILPAPHMTDKIYLAQCQLLSDALTTTQLSNISLIVYPTSATNLSLYNQDFITYIGTVLQKQEDLETLDAIYNYFSTKKSLFVRDNIRQFYSTDSSKAAKEINAIYYTLAVKYPGIETIFSPCIIPTIDYQDSYALDHSAEDFYLFYTIYNRLLEKSWITTTDDALGNISPYVPLQSYDSLSGEIEIILSPDSRILSSLATVTNSTSGNYYISFKWNASTLPVTSNYPYAIVLDTTTLPNGISRLKAILQSSSSELIESSSIDLTIDNPLSSVRSVRIASSTSPSTAYTKPQNDYIPILMYHTVEDTIDPELQNSCVETANFEAQMKALLDHGYTPINFYNLKEYLNGTAVLPEHPIIITMDDGYLNNYTKAYPIFKKYNIQATLFVSPYYMAEANTERHFGWDSAKEMEESGLIDIQPHGYNHTPFPYLSLKDLQYHISLANGLIEMHLGPRDVSVVACPEFRNTYHTRKLLRSLGMDFQITKLATKGTVLTPTSLKRINVPNTMSPDELIATLNTLTS